MQTAVILVLAVVGSFMSEQTRTDDVSRVTLRGLRGVEVLVGNLTPAAERAGLSRNQLQTDVELRLRSHGITVVSRQAAFQIPGQPYLYIDPLVSEGGLGLHPWVVDVSLRQRLVLERDTTIAIYAPTWESRGLLSISTAANLPRNVSDAVLANVDQFINAYLAANER